MPEFHLARNFQGYMQSQLYFHKVVITRKISKSFTLSKMCKAKREY